MNIKLLKKLRKKAKKDFEWKIHKISDDKYILLNKVGTRDIKLYMIGLNKYSYNPYVKEIPGLSKKEVISIYKEHEREFINIEINNLRSKKLKHKKISLNKILWK